MVILRGAGDGIGMRHTGWIPQGLAWDAALNPQTVLLFATLLCVARFPRFILGVSHSSKIPFKQNPDQRCCAKLKVRRREGRAGNFGQEPAEKHLIIVRRPGFQSLASKTGTGSATPGFDSGLASAFTARASVRFSSIRGGG
ncbi:hypothetical protein [Thiomonas delicata]|uniref:hypothetical protein n=1 Tax=Thiomonas delicata TaxID=364030 RepID=UPI001646487D|nr:hypothetical protein [Thiomonas delicata]